MEARCPFVDWDLMYFMRSIPANYFLETGKTKPILKHFLSDFPDWFLERKKMGFGFNFRYLMIPLYKNIYYQIDWNNIKNLTNTLNYPKFNHLIIFKNFDYFWKRYILSKLLT